MTNIDTAQVLEDAADLLLIKGRCQSVGRNNKEEYCVLGAIAEVQGIFMSESGDEIYNDSDPAVIALARHVAPQVNASGYQGHCNRPCTYVYAWNDWLDHDDFEVIDTLRHVAKDLRNSVV